MRALKRSGETLEARGTWKGMGNNFYDVVKLFESDAVSSKLAYDVLREAPVVVALEAAAQEAALRRLIKRHKSNQYGGAETLAAQLSAWAAVLDERIPKPQDPREPSGGLFELGKWLVLARFIAQGGGE